MGQPKEDTVPKKEERGSARVEEPVILTDVGPLNVFEAELKAEAQYSAVKPIWKQTHPSAVRLITKEST